MLSAFRYSKVAKNIIRVNSFMGITNEYFTSFWEHIVRR